LSVSEYAPAKIHAQISALHRELLELREACGQITGYIGGFGARKYQVVRAMPSEALALPDVEINFYNLYSMFFSITPLPQLCVTNS
jgi:hypothetical protein